VKRLKTDHVYAPKPIKSEFMLSFRGQRVAVLRKFESSQHLLLIIPIRCYRYHYPLLLFKEEGVGFAKVRGKNRGF
jgi:hypothetical protein